jgi:hypothetical protein
MTIGRVPGMAASDGAACTSVVAGAAGARRTIGLGAVTLISGSTICARAACVQAASSTAMETPAANRCDGRAGHCISTVTTLYM